MTEERKPEPKPEDPTKTTETQSTELNKEDMENISGGPISGFYQHQ